MEEQILHRMREVIQAVEDLPEPFRPAAFVMMKDYILGRERVAESLETPSDQAGDSKQKEDFFSQREFKRPADAAMGIAAYLYSLYGSQPFSTQDIKQLADEVGLTIPDRLDMTLKGAKRGGRPLFRLLGRGQYAPTVLGERTLRDEYEVTKGRRRRDLDIAG